MKKHLLIFGIILLFIFSALVPMSIGYNVKTSKSINNGNTLYVGGSGPGNYSMIQDAIDNASDGDTVFVYDDSSPYYELVIVDKRINLIGEDRNTTIIHGIDDYGPVVVLSYKTSNILVSGFTITNGYRGIRVDGSDNIIQGNKIIRNRCGIYIGHDDDKNNQIRYNLILHNSETGVFDGTHYNTNFVTWNVIGGNGKGPYYYHNAGVYKHRCGGIFHHNDFDNNWGPNVDTQSSANGGWDDGSEGNYWDDWESNPGYPDKYFISSWNGLDQYDYHPKATSYFNYTIVLIDRLYFEKNPGESIHFDTNINRPPSSVSWFWDFGDGNTSNESNPIHSYSESGIYNINVTVTDEKGQSDMDKCIAYIGFCPDKPIITGPTNGRTNIVYEYSILVNDSDSDFITLCIDWEGFLDYEYIGPIPSGEEIIVSHYWGWSYNYTVMVRAIDETFREGEWAQFDVTITEKSKALSSSLLLRLIRQFPLLTLLLQILY